MGEAVKQRRRHLGVAEHGSPFAEAQVGRDDDAGSLVELAEQMEEQRSAGGAERQVAELVKDDEVGIGEPPGDLPRLSLKLLLFEGVDELNGREEPDALAVMLDGLDADGRGEMRLTRARRTSVILPGVRRLKSGSRTSFTRARVISSRWSASGGMQAPITSLSGSPIAPWRCCRPG